MIDAIEEIKARARVLHRRAQSGDPQAVQRIGRLPEFREDLPEHGSIQRKHCLATIGRELGFSSWPHAHRVLMGTPDEVDFGVLLYPSGCSAFTNHWFARYEDARRTHALVGGYLLAYRHQFFVVTREYVATLGLDPDDPEWTTMGHDWARPLKLGARRRLYAKLVANRPREAA